jgi:hypothetical protein
MIIANQWKNESGVKKSYISLEGSGENIADILKYQFRANQGNATLWNDFVFMIEQLRSGKKVPQEFFDEKLPINIAQMFSHYQEYLISWMKYTPAIVIQNLSIPKVLIVQGSTDIQITPLNGELLRKACPRATYAYIEKMSHPLKFANSTNNADQMDSYYKPDYPLHPDLVPAIVAFLNNLDSEVI